MQFQESFYATKLLNKLCIGYKLKDIYDTLLKEAKMIVNPKKVAKKKGF